MLALALAFAPGLGRAQDAGVPDAGVPDAGPPPDAGPSDHAASDDAGAPDPHADPPPPPRLLPPRVITSPPPHYPDDRLGDGAHPTVVLLVTLDEHGHVMSATVEHGAEPEFDAAAVEAVTRSWTFAPAERGGQPIAARVRVAVHFELPSFDAATTEAIEGSHPESHPEMNPARPHVHTNDPPPAEEAAADGADHEASGEPALGVTAEVEGAGQREEERGAGAFEVDRDILEAAPRQDGADLLLSVPGVFAARAEGLAVGQRINLRGFDAEHGQDIELTVGGLPVNLPSHIHGQGYADLGFLIPEVVRRVQVTEGVADPRQGDFAVAGSVRFELGVEERRRGWRVESGYGLFHAFRQLVMFAPEGEREETFGAVQYQRTDGYGQNRGGDAVSAIVQVGARDGSWRWRGLGILHGARADLAGVVRADDVQAGRVGFYDSYPVTSAQSQNALSGRFLGGFFGDWRGDDGANASLGLWVGADAFRVQENFTGFIQRSRTLAGVAGRGDLIEQQNQTLSAGLLGRYRSAPWRPFDEVAARVELGLDGRFDHVGQTQNLLGAPRNQTWDRRVDASILGTQVGLWGEVELTITDYLRVHGGLRAALLLYEIDDRLGNFVPLVRPMDEFIMGFRRSAGGATVGPRASAELRPLDWLSIRAGYGHGYRSPQARTLADSEAAPFTEVRGADLGATATYGRYLRVSVAGYWTELSDDVAFEPREGRLERIGASRRLGAVLYAQARPLDWLVGALSVTYVDAELLEPPPPTADDPQPAFTEGQNLPYVPPVVIRADVGVNGPLIADVLGETLTGRIGIGYSFLSPRPLPFGGFADAVNLLDASAGVGWGPLDLGVSFFNLFDQRWAASEFLFTSSWDPTGIPDRVPARHLSAGSPFRFMVTLGVSP